MLDIREAEFGVVNLIMRMRQVMLNGKKKILSLIVPPAQQEHILPPAQQRVKSVQPANGPAPRDHQPAHHGLRPPLDIMWWMVLEQKQLIARLNQINAIAIMVLA